MFVGNTKSIFHSHKHEHFYQKVQYRITSLSSRLLTEGKDRKIEKWSGRDIEKCAFHIFEIVTERVKELEGKRKCCEEIVKTTPFCSSLYLLLSIYVLNSFHSLLSIPRITGNERNYFSVYLLPVLERRGS